MTLLWWFILGFAIIGFFSTVCFFLLILGTCCFGGKREDLSKFGRDPFEPKLTKIVPGPWCKR